MITRFSNSKSIFPVLTREASNVKLIGVGFYIDQHYFATSFEVYRKLSTQNQNKSLLFGNKKISWSKIDESSKVVIGRIDEESSNYLVLSEDFPGTENIVNVYGYEVDKSRSESSDNFDFTSMLELIHPTSIYDEVSTNTIIGNSYQSHFIVSDFGLESASGAPIVSELGLVIGVCVENLFDGTSLCVKSATVIELLEDSKIPYESVDKSEITDVDYKDINN